MISSSALRSKEGDNKSSVSSSNPNSSQNKKESYGEIKYDFMKPISEKSGEMSAFMLSPKAFKGVEQPLKGLQNFVFPKAKLSLVQVDEEGSKAN